MKASIVSVHQGPSISKVITRLTLLGVFVLGGMYAFWQTCATLIKFFQ